MGYVLFEPCWRDSRQEKDRGKRKGKREREREREKKKDLRWMKHGRVRHLGIS